MVNLQVKLLKDGKPRNTKDSHLNNLNDKSFLFLCENITDSLRKKKVIESIEVMGGSNIGLVYNRKEVPNFFENISSKGNLANAYREVYSSLLNICKKFEPSESESEDYESESEDYSEVPSKQVKAD